MRTLKSKEAKKLIGKKVRWVEAWDAHGGVGIPRSGVLLEVKGKNVRFESDWKWLPDMYFLEEVKE